VIHHLAGFAISGVRKKLLNVQIGVAYLVRGKAKFELQDLKGAIKVYSQTQIIDPVGIEANLLYGNSKLQLGIMKNHNF
jgi:hypothetical protein